MNAATGELRERIADIATSNLTIDERDEIYRAVWREFYPRAKVFAATILGKENPELDDAVQEAMIKVLQNLDRYRPVYAVSTWVYTIVKNHCLDVLKRSKRRHRRFGFGIDIESEASRDPGPEEQAIIDEKNIDIERAIAGLKGHDRQIAYLRFYEELGYREIGMILGIPVGTAKYRVHMIRKKLSAQLGGRDES